MEKGYFGDYGNLALTVDVSSASLLNTFNPRLAGADRWRAGRRHAPAVTPITGPRTAPARWVGRQHHRRPAAGGAPMIGRASWIKLVVFVVVTVLGVGYVLVHYIGAGRTLLGQSYTAYVDLPDSGGIFTTASVTYRGVEIGRVGEISLRDDGIRVALDMNSQPAGPVRRTGRDRQRLGPR